MSSLKEEIKTLENERRRLTTQLQVVEIELKKLREKR